MAIDLFRIIQFDDLANEGIARAVGGKCYWFNLHNMGLPEGGYHQKDIVGLYVQVDGVSFWSKDMDQIWGTVLGLDPVMIRDEFHENWLLTCGYNRCTFYAYKLDYSQSESRPKRVNYKVYLAENGTVDTLYEEYLQSPQGLYDRALWELSKVPNLRCSFGFLGNGNVTAEDKYLLMPDVTGDEETKALFSLLGGSITFNRDGSWAYHVPLSKQGYHDTIHLLGKRLGVVPTQYGKNSTYEGNYFLMQRA